VRAVRCEPGRGDVRLVGGEPPRPAAGRRREPDVVSRDENNLIAINMRILQVSW
jgi:hypothetical protein